MSSIVQFHKIHTPTPRKVNGKTKWVGGGWLRQWAVQTQKNLPLGRYGNTPPLWVALRIASDLKKSSVDHAGFDVTLVFQAYYTAFGKKYYFLSHH